MKNKFSCKLSKKYNIYNFLKNENTQLNINLSYDICKTKLKNDRLISEMSLTQNRPIEFDFSYEQLIVDHKAILCHYIFWHQRLIGCSFAIYNP